MDFLKGRPVKTIEKYVFGSFLSAFVLAFLVLSFVLTVALMVEIIGYVLEGMPGDLVWRFALVSFPETMQWTIPIGLLAAGVLVFSRLSADSEIAAMRACGVSLLSVMRWPVAFAALCSVACMYVNNEIVPRGHEVRRALKDRISVDTGLELLEAGRVIDDFPNVKIYFDSKEGNWLNDLCVWDYSNRKVARLITASRALVSTDGTAVVLDLRNMTIDPLDDAHPQMAHAQRFNYRVENALRQSKLKRKDKDLRFAEIRAKIKERKAEVADATAKCRAYEGGDKDAKDKLDKGRRAMRRALSDIQTEYQRRWVFAMASICFVLVGIPLGIRAQRRESTIGMAISLAVALGYNLVVILMLSISKNYHAHPECLIWIPVAACFALAAWLIPKNL